MKKKNVLGKNVKAVDSPISYKFDKINNKNKNKHCAKTTFHFLYPL